MPTITNKKKHNKTKTRLCPQPDKKIPSTLLTSYFSLISGSKDQKQKNLKKSKNYKSNKLYNNETSLSFKY